VETATDPAFYIIGLIPKAEANRWSNGKPTKIPLVANTYIALLAIQLF
jgi:hypothetical protein